MANKRKEYKNREVELEEKLKVFETSESDIELPTYPIKLPIYSVRVTHPSLRARKAPSFDAAIDRLITDQGVYEIFKQENGWGQLSDENWIYLEFTSKI